MTAKRAHEQESATKKETKKSKSSQQLAQRAIDEWIEYYAEYLVQGDSGVEQLMLRILEKAVCDVAESVLERVEDPGGKEAAAIVRAVLDHVNDNAKEGEDLSYMKLVKPAEGAANKLPGYKLCDGVWVKCN